MSHFTTVQVQIKDGSLLCATLRDLGYEVVENGVVRGYLWQRTRADYVIKQKNGFDIGFRRQGDHYELISDVWGAGVTPEAFLKPILQKYAHKKLLRTLQEQGATIEAEEHLADGTIRVVVGQWR